MKRYLQCAEQQESASNFSKYCACQEKWLSWSILFTHETLFTTRGATSVIVQTHQILRLPRKMNLMIDPCHTWNAIYNARSNTCHCPNSPNTAPATKNESHDWSLSHMKRYLQCAEEQVSLSKLTKYCACHEKWISWLILVTHERLFTMRGATSVIVQTHQILRLPRKMNLMIDPCHTWNAIYNARSNKCHCPNSPNTAPATQNDSPKFCKNFSKTAETSFPMRGRSETIPSWIRAGSDHETVTPQPASQARLLFTPTTSILYWKIQYFALRLSFQISPNAAPATKSDSSTSPNTAPATKNESHDWSLSHMKRYLQCAEQQESASNFSKYCACHEKWISWLILVTHETLFTMRGGTSVIVQTHQILRLPRKMNLMIDPCHTWKAIYNARSNTCHCPNSPNTAPATKNESHDWSLSHMKRYLQCAEQQVSLSKLTKYCACHEKWISWLILVTHETPFTMRGATSVIVQTHQILRLPRKMTLQNFAKISRKQLKRHLLDPSWIRPWNRHSATRLASEVTFHAHHEHFVLKNTIFRAPAIIPNFTECCACHEKWQFNITKYCACHEKRISWLIPVTHETLFTMRGATSVIVQTHQILRLPRKMNLMIDPCHIWNVIYNARNNRWHPPTSPNTAPATQNDSPTFQRNFSKTAETSFPMRGRSEHDPSRIRAGSEHETVTPQPASQPRLLFTPTTSILYWKIQHFALRLSFQISPNTAPATKSDTSTSPNTAPATKSDCHDWSSSHMKRYLQCAEQQMASSNITEYCACHAKWLSNISKKFLENSWNVISNAGPIRAWSDHDLSRIRAWNRHSATRLATEVTFHAHHEHFVLKNTTFRAPAIIPNFTEYCACHEKWHFNFTEYCACHEKWHLNSTKQCTCHEKSHYATLLFSSILATILLRISSQTNLISYESNLLRISSQTNLMSNASNLLRISSHKNLISYESLLKRISSQTHLISYESLLKRI